MVAGNRQEIVVMPLNRLLALGLALLFTAGLATSSAAGDWSKIRIGTEGAYAPFNFHDAAGKLQGFDIDIVQALCDRMGAKCEFIALQFDGIILALQNNQIDAIATSMAITEKRKKVVDFTDKYWIRHARFMSCTTAPVEDTSPAAMKGRAIGTQGGTVSDDFLEAEYKGADVRLYKTMDEAYQDAAAGRLDAVLAGEAVSFDFMRKEPGKNCKFVGERLPDGKYFGAGVGIAVRKTDTDLRDKLNAAMKQIRADGTYEAINKKYFPFSIY
jgi:polar amino acid transport system substrate-binding protein